MSQSLPYAWALVCYMWWTSPPAISLLLGHPKMLRNCAGGISQPGVKDLTPTSLAEAQLVLKQEMPALTLKQEGGPGGKTMQPAPGLVSCSDLGCAAGGRSLRRGVTAAQWVFKTLGTARRWGAGPWCCSWAAQTLTRVRLQLEGVFLCSFCEAFAL